MHLVQGSPSFLRLSLHQRVGALCSMDVGAQSVYVIWAVLHGPDLDDQRWWIRSKCECTLWDNVGTLDRNIVSSPRPYHGLEDRHH